MAYFVNPNKDSGQTRGSTVHKRVEGLRTAALKMEEPGEFSQLSAAELAFAFFAWLIAFAAFGKAVLLAWTYFA